MGRTASGKYLGVSPDWFRKFAVDEAALKAIYTQVRAEAAAAGCRNFPGRDDVAANQAFFDDIVARYEKTKGLRVPCESYPHFRRWILLLLFKGGDMPRS